MIDPTRLHAPARLEAVAGTGVGAFADEAFDAYARLTRRLLKVPVALVTLVEADRQVFPGAAGLPATVDAERQTPLSHSFCQTVVATDEPLVVGDAVTDLRVADNLAVPDLGVRSYLGMPVHDQGGHVLGALCVWDEVPRVWTAEEQVTLREIADGCAGELRLRTEARRDRDRAREARDALAAATDAREQAEASAASSLLALTRAESAQADAERSRYAAELALQAARDARQDVQRSHDRLLLLSRLTDALTSTLQTDEALRRLVRIVVPDAADWAVADTYADGVTERVAVAHGGEQDVGLLLGVLPRGGEEGAVTGSLAHVLHDGVRRRVRRDDLDNPALDGLARAQVDLFHRLGIVEAVVLPLRVADAVFGAITLVRTKQPFGDEDLLLADEIAARASLALDNARLYEQQRTVAETLQRSLLTYLPEPDHLEIAARYLPATQGAQVGGDWYDAFLTRDGATVLSVGDVLGHDMGAAALMAEARNLLRGIALNGHDEPADLVHRLDGTSESLRLGLLATAVVGRLTQTPEQRRDGLRTFEWTNAGHPPPMLLSADGAVSMLEGEPDLMLGVDADTGRSSLSATLRPGDTVLLYTDGLVERSGLPLGDGLAHLRQVLASVAGRTLEEGLDHVLGRIVPAPQPDDIAVLAVRAHPEDRPRPPEAGPSHL